MRNCKLTSDKKTLHVYTYSKSLSKEVGMAKDYIQRVGIVNSPGADYWIHKTLITWLINNVATSTTYPYSAIIDYYIFLELRMHTQQKIMAEGTDFFYSRRNYAGSM